MQYSQHKAYKKLTKNFALQIDHLKVGKIALNATGLFRLAIEYVFQSSFCHKTHEKKFDVFSIKIAHFVVVLDFFMFF